MEFQFEHWIFAFFLFTMIGWVQESILESLYHRKLINRGFLKGPYIPIYGVGGCLLLLCCLPFSYNGFLVFIVGMVSCTTLEFLVGLLMEKVFNKQFWDYSMFKLTYKNRISLVPSLFWGVMALFMVYVLYGLVVYVCVRIPHIAVIVFDIVMAAAMLTDTIFTVRKNLCDRRADSSLGAPDNHEINKGLTEAK